MELDVIHNEDCLVTMGKMGSEYIDLVVTSPPYDDLRTYEGYSFEFEKVAEELFRVMKTGGVVVWIASDATIKGGETGTSFRQALYFQKLGFSIYDTMIFKKENYIPLTHRRYEQCFEFMFIFSKGKVKTFNPIKVPTKFPGKVEEYSTKRRQSFGKRHSMSVNKERKLYVTKKEKIAPNIFSYIIGQDKLGHPAPFPESLARDQILSWSNEGELVYDPFMGSGTTAKAAKVFNRKYIGSEISKKYCEIAEKRVVAVQGKLLW